MLLWRARDRGKCRPFRRTIHHGNEGRSLTGRHETPVANHPPRKECATRLKRLLLILLLAASLISLAAFGRNYLRRLEAEHWRRQFAAASDQDAAAWIQSIPWDEDSQRLPLLLDALGSPRTCVREAAEQALRETAGRWQALPPAERSARVAALADTMVALSHDFDARACREAKEWIAQILQWPSGGDLAESGRTIAFVNACSCDGRSPACDLSTADGNRGGDGAIPATSHEPPPLTDAADSLPQLPGGAIPVERFSLPQLPMIAPAEPTSATTRSEPRTLTIPTRPQPLVPQPPDGALSAATASANRGHQNPHNGGATRATSLAEFRARVGITPVVAITGMEQRETIDLMRDLSSTDPSIESKARTELMQRGFTDFHLKFARRLFDPDPAVRREVAQMLPGLPGVDRAPWLLHLCRDDDPEVRLTAVSLIVTTGNPALLEKVEAIARADSDPRIQNQAEQIAQFRRRSASGSGFR